METKEKAKTILNWDYINKEFESAIIQEDDDLNLIKRVYVGDYTMIPSGKVYTSFSYDNVTEEEIELDNQLIQALNEEVADYEVPIDIEWQYIMVDEDIEGIFVVRVITDRNDRFNDDD